MSLFLQFNNLIENETARKAMESYVGFLKKAFEQYRDLWEDYIKLQEKHEQCNVSSPSQITIVEPCIKTKDELKVESQLNNIITQTSSDNSLLELNSLYIDTQKIFEDDMEDDLANLSADFLDDSQSKSPVFSKTHSKTNSTFAKMVMRSPEAVSVCSKSTADTEIFHNEKVLSKCKRKLEISTTYHVETTFLPSGKKLKQSRLMFHPIKHDKEKIPLLDVNELKSAGTIQKEKQNLTSDIKELITIEDNATGANETFEDVIEIGPTQSDIHSKSKHCLKLKRKVPGQTITNSLDKNKYHSLKSNFATKTATNDIGLDLDPLPIFTSAQIINESPVKESKIVGALKHNTNTNNFLLTHKSSKANVKSTKSIDNQGKGQIAKYDVQNIFQNLSDEDETFYLPAEQTANKNETDDFTLNDTENKPPAKNTLNKFYTPLKKKECVLEQLNMRCKADRAKLNGWDCWECEEYYKNLSLSKEELQKRKNQCSRHRQRYERPNTPEGFWDPEFPETLSSTYRHNIK